MPKAYLIAEHIITEPAVFEEYRVKVGPMIEKYGGRYLTKGSAHQLPEGGHWQPERVVIIEFPDKQSLDAWYNSPEYQPLIKLRKESASDLDMLITLEGVAATREVNMEITKVLGSKHDDIAPDGSEVRLLPEMTRGGMAHFALGPRNVSKAVAHKTIEEIWYFIRGRGRMWRRPGNSEGEGQVVDVFPGVSITVPTGTQFQFRNDGDEALEAIGVTMPPWPGPDEAFQVKGIWEPTV